MLAKYDILSPYNYVALPRTSTAEPIHILTHIIEDANINNKELWLLSQDMSKAYDSIHIPLLMKAMQRIKIPEPIINLLSNIFAGRTNQVITNFGNTQSYQVHDGVDQGETIAPILWRIYYDPLLTEIVQKVKGYSINATIPSNIKTSSPL